ncbi:hypothetical protein CRUP_011579, partial [Coryphaenoides rupestris]
MRASPIRRARTTPRPASPPTRRRRPPLPARGRTTRRLRRSCRPPPRTRAPSRRPSWDSSRRSDHRLAWPWCDTCDDMAR